MKSENIQQTILSSLSSWYSKEALFTRAPIFGISCQDCAKQSYLYSNTFLEALEKNKVISSRYDFGSWLKLDERNRFYDYNRNCFDSFHSFLEHMLLSQHKKRGAVILYIPSDVSLKGHVAYKLLEELRSFKKYVLFFLISSEKNMQALHSLNNAIQVFSCDDMLCTSDILFGPVWRHVDVRTKMLLLKNPVVFQHEEFIDEVNWTFCTVHKKEERYEMIHKIVETAQEKSSRETACKMGFA